MTAKPYRILVTGSRDWKNPKTIRDALWGTVGNLPANRPPIIVHGDCPTGADHIAKAWTLHYGNAFNAKHEPHPAENHGPWPRCGPIRNWHMVNLGADLCLAFISDCTSQRCHRPRPHPSHGATGCADLAERNGIETRRWTA